MIAVTTYATQAYEYSVRAMARHVAAAVQHHAEGLFVFAGDRSPVIEKAAAYVKSLLPKWKHEFIALKLDDHNERYKQDAQLVISRLQTAAFQAARQSGADACWSVEADLLVPPNALRVSEDMLRFDSGYYDVAMVTYPNDAFLGGRGTPQQQICESYDPLERYMPLELKRRFAQMLAEGAEFERDARLPETVTHRAPSDDWKKSSEEVWKDVRSCPPALNIWQSNAENGWRKRGWFMDAYPAVGRGAVLPTDWVGLGCTLLSKKALSLTQFEGYELKGTQDLYLCWQRWYPAGLKFCVIPHIVADHIKRDRTDPKKLIHLHAYHETDGLYEGHLRVKQMPWIDHGEPK